MSTKKVTVPLARYIVLEQVMHQTSNIILDENTIKDKALYDFVVVAVGPECTRGLKPDDIVIASDGLMGVPVPDGDRHFLVSETDIIGKVRFEIETH